jgi:hypothetical protein
VPPQVEREADVNGMCAMDEATLFRHLSLLLEAQRKNRFSVLNGEPFHGVGGYAVATIVTADGIRQKVFRRWPQDRVGARIDVLAGENISPTTPEERTASPINECLQGPGSLAFAGGTTEGSQAVTPADLERTSQENLASTAAPFELSPVDVSASGRDVTATSPGGSPTQEPSPDTMANMENPSGPSVEPSAADAVQRAAGEQPADHPTEAPLSPSQLLDQPLQGERQFDPGEPAIGPLDPAINDFFLKQMDQPWERETRNIPGGLEPGTEKTFGDYLQQLFASPAEARSHARDSWVQAYQQQNAESARLYSGTPTQIQDAITRQGFDAGRADERQNIARPCTHKSGLMSASVRKRPNWCIARNCRFVPLPVVSRCSKRTYANAIIRSPRRRWQAASAAR